MSDYEDNSSDEEEESAGFVKGRDAFIYVIDALLFQNEEHFQEACTTIREAFLSGIIFYPKELIGVVFHNTKFSPNPKDEFGIEDLVILKNQCVFLPLKCLSKDIVSYFQDFCTKEYFDFENTYGMEEGSFSSTIRLCCSMFHNCRPKPGSETIVFFTDKELPHPENSNEFQKSMIKAHDLKDINVDFEVMPMCNDFNYEPFYKEFLCLVKGYDIESFEIVDDEHKKEMFKTHQLAMNLKNRCVCSLKWNLGDGVNLSVGYYNNYSKSCYPKPVKLLRSDNSIIDVKRVKEVKYLEELGESSESRVLLPGEEVQSLKHGGDSIILTADDVSKLKTPIQPSLRLVGFIENESVPLEMYIKPSGFIYPNEKDILGSTKLFTALWQKCLEMNKAAVCILAKKRKSYPSFVVLEPQQYSSENYKKHDGFNVFYLPSFDNIRNVDTSEWKTEKPSDEQISTMKSIIKKLRSNFDPTSKAFTDPALDELNFKLIALAFDLETEEVVSGINPNISEQDDRIKITVKELTEIYGEDDPVVTKRPRPAGNNENAVKKPKVSGDVDENIIVEMVNRNALGALSITQLKSYLQSKGISGISKFTKPLLIEKVMNLHS